MGSRSMEKVPPLEAAHPPAHNTHTYPGYGERNDFQTYVNMNYLLATWPTAPAAVYKLIALPCFSFHP